MEPGDEGRVPRALTRREEAVLAAMIEHATPMDDDVPVTDADRTR